jgi:acyl-CoA synthetase (AMP-forming)/AMP-acid ligase II
MSYLIHHFLEKSADVCPDKEALIHGETRLSYKAIERYSNAFANWLLSKKLSGGERVALLLRNSTEYVLAYYGGLKAGCIVVPLNTGLKSLEIRYMLEDCEPMILITQQRFSKIIKKAFVDLKIRPKMLVGVGEESRLCDSFNGEYISLIELFYRYPPTRPNLSIIDRDIASIIYTSGSTGKPKGAMLSHLNIVSNTRSILKYLRLNKNDRCIVILPFYYVYGKSLLNTHFAVSGTVVIDNRFSFPNAVLSNMIKERVTGFAGVPSTYSTLLDRSNIKKLDFPNLRYLTQAGGHMSSRIKKDLMRIFPDKEIYIMYGATEASSRLSYLPPNEMMRRISSIGKPIPNVEMKVFDNNGRETNPGEEGEIVARGSNIMYGYWNSHEETAKVLREGWYHTGDLGVRDKDGYFYITGREREIIKVRFYKISAIEIEEVLYDFPGVHEAVVIGVPDNTLGEAIMAFIVPKTGSKFSVENVKRYCKNFLTKYKIPKEIIIANNLPKNETGKILKNKLREKYSND